MSDPTQNQNFFAGLLDQFGRPLSLRPAERDESLLGHYDAYQAIAMAIPSYNPDAFVNTKGWETLEGMLSLGAVRTPLNIVRDAVLHKGWTIQPAITDKAHGDYEAASKIADALTYALDNIVDEWGNSQDFRGVLWEMLYAIHTGFRITEIQWRTIESGAWAGQWGFAGFDAKPCKMIGFDLDPDRMVPKGITSYTPTKGYRYSPVEKVLRYTFAPVNGLPHGQGVGRAAYKHSWSLDFLYRFWNLCLEVFGSPFILAKAPSAQVSLARKLLAEIRQGAPGVVPNGVEAELVEMNGASATGFKTAAEHHIGEIGKLYTYAALTSGEGQRVGSMALGNVHQDTQGYSVGGRRTDIEQVVNFQLIRRWVIYNFGEEALPLAPSLKLGESDESEVQRLGDSFQKLVNAKILHPGEPQIRERMGLAPLEPELREAMEKSWNAADAPPSIVPGSAGDSADEQDDAEDKE